MRKTLASLFKKVTNTRGKFVSGKKNTCKADFVFVTQNSKKHTKIEKGAEDFAIRFEDVMKELANG